MGSHPPHATHPVHGFFDKPAQGFVLPQLQSLMHRGEAFHGASPVLVALLPTSTEEIGPRREIPL